LTSSTTRSTPSSSLINLHCLPSHRQTSSDRFSRARLLQDRSSKRTCGKSCRSWRRTSLLERCILGGGAPRVATS
jgi:hypothetical protein